LGVGRFGLDWEKFFEHEVGKDAFLSSLTIITLKIAYWVALVPVFLGVICSLLFEAGDWERGNPG